jgi:hypothetical protein
MSVSKYGVNPFKNNKVHLCKSQLREKTREFHKFDLDGQGQLKVKVTSLLLNMFL